MSENPDKPPYISPDGGGVHPGHEVDTQPLPVLGREVRSPIKQLDVFSNPGVQVVVMDAEEFTSLCPVTGQPDMGMVRVEYIPTDKCLESKSLKLYLWTYREAGVFCEQLAVQIAVDIGKALDAQRVQVTVQQKPRGGIGVRATSVWTKPDEKIARPVPLGGWMPKGLRKKNG